MKLFLRRTLIRSNQYSAIGQPAKNHWLYKLSPIQQFNLIFNKEAV